MTAKRILIADDHEVVRSGVRAIIESHDNWEVVGEADNGKDAIKLILEKMPDVAIVDYSLPLINGVEVARNVAARQLKVEIMIFTMHDSDVLAQEAFRAGARAFLLKSEANRQLSSAVEALLLHKPFFGGAVAEKLLVNCLAANTTQLNSLTPRERMVVQLISEGHSNKSMSEVLNLSVKTIETHRASAMHRLSVKSTAALVRYAIKNMFIQP